MRQPNLSRRWLLLVIALILIISLLPGITWAQTPETPHIYLQVATFDPLRGEPDLFINRDPAASSVESTTFLLQFVGPVQEAWKTAIEERDVRFYGYIPDYAFIVQMDPAVIARIRALSFVRWVGRYRPAYRLAPTLQRAVSEQPDFGAVALVVQTIPDADLEHLASKVKSLGATIEGRSKNDLAGYLRMTLPSERLGELAALDGVLWVEPYFEAQLFNDVAGGSIMKAATVRSSLGLYGNGQVVAVADTGLDTGEDGPNMSQDFVDQLLSGESICESFGGRLTWNDFHGHGTHVSGSVLGNGSLSGSNPTLHQYDNSFAGVAPESKLVFQAIGDSDGSLCAPTDLKTDLFDPAYSKGARIHSNSWGGPTGGTQDFPEYGGYTSRAQSADQTSWSHSDLLILFAAGNSGVDADSNGLVDLDSIGSPGTAKNAITVGASESDRDDEIVYEWGFGWPEEFPAEPIFSDHVSNDPDGMAAFSSRGPADDGRIKPDLVAPGTFIISARSHDPAAGTGWGLVDDHYVYNGGTSMATPLTAGAAALVREWLTTIRGYLDPSAALMKAVLINGAADMSPGQYNKPQEIPSQRPNNVSGWGRVDLAASLKPPAPQRIWLKDQLGGVRTDESSQFTLLVGTTPSVALAGDAQARSIHSGNLPSSSIPPGEISMLADQSLARRLEHVEISIPNLDAGGQGSAQLIQNGGFETSGSWVYSNTERTDTQFHSGSWSAGSKNASAGAFYQTVDFPSDAITSTLSYHWKNLTPDVDVDDLRVYINNSDNSVVYGVGPDHSSIDTSWHAVTLDLSPILDQVRGETISVYFLINTDGLVPNASFFVDDVNLNVGKLSTGGPFRISLVWTDYPGSLSASKALVNDLDLEVIAPDGQHYYGNSGIYNAGHSCLRDSKWDKCNNVEGVLIPEAYNGTYSIIVHGHNVPNGPQSFALVASGDYLKEEIHSTYLPLIIH